jgi:hypothetical protein
LRPAFARSGGYGVMNSNFFSDCNKKLHLFNLTVEGCLQHSGTQPQAPEACSRHAGDLSYCV